MFATFNGRAAVKIISDSIPLQGSKEVAELVDSYSTSATPPENLTERLKSAYSMAASKAAADSLTIGQILKNQGGAGFSRSERRAFMSDSLLVENILKKEPNSQALKAVACTANASYGQGADKLDRASFIASILITGGISTVGKISPQAVKIGAGLNNARTLGYLSYNSAQSVKTAALFGLGVASLSNASLKAAEIVDRACFNPSRFNLQQDAGSCVGSPRVEDLTKDNCVVAASISALSLMLPGTLSTLAVERSANERLISLVRNSRRVIDPVRATRRRTVYAETVATSSLATYHWSATRYGGRNPWDYQRDLKTRATELNDLSLEKARVTRQRDQLVSLRNPVNQNLINSLNLKVKSLDEEMYLVKNRFDEIAPSEVSTFLGTEHDEYGIRRAMHLPNNFQAVASMDPNVRKGSFNYRTGSKRYRYSVVLCNKNEGCPRGEQTIEKDGIIALEPLCGPDVFKVQMSGATILEQIRNQTFNAENVSQFVPCP